MYTIILNSDDMISCEGIYQSYYETIGQIVCSMADSIQDWERNNYVLKKRVDFVKLEGDTGWMWSIAMFHKNADINIKEIWYLLEVPEEEAEETRPARKFDPADLPF